MREAFKIITCCGDEARAIFQEEFLEDVHESITDKLYSSGELKSVVFTSTELELPQNDTVLIIQSDKVPTGIILEFPRDVFNSHSVVFGSPCDKLLMFNRFPYRKRSLVVKLAEMTTQTAVIDSEVVLMKVDRRFAATDILSFDDTLEIAIADYGKIANRVYQYQRGDDKTKLFCVKANMLCNFRHRYLASIDEALSRFHTEFEFKYASLIGLPLKKQESILADEAEDITELINLRIKDMYTYFLKDINFDKKASEAFLNGIIRHYNNEKYTSDGLRDYLRDELSSKINSFLTRIALV